jgi:hypothetical protein
MNAHPPEIVSEAPAKRKRNWWKVAFFVLLFVFECTREWAVIASTEPAEPNSSGMVMASTQWAQATGQWKRIDGGSKLMPAAVSIQCSPEPMPRCIEASAMIMDKSVMPPDIDVFDATFTPDAITYENDAPMCARYTVRIDLKLQKVFAVRQNKAGAKDLMGKPCDIEDRIEMQLGTKYEFVDHLQGHFLPVTQTILAVSKMF